MKVLLIGVGEAIAVIMQDKPWLLIFHQSQTTWVHLWKLMPAHSAVLGAIPSVETPPGTAA